MQKITPFLWFDNQAEEAMTFYTSVFKNAKVGKVVRYGEAGPGPAGSVLTASFELEGMEFTALNGGPQFKFTDGGQIQQCGWVKDRFGLCWQVVPSALGKLLGDPDRAKSNRVMQAMLQMKKLDIAKLEQAAKG
jgi:predicted 3-demethylubiquinone-9 3-methyltransferase (glyoxalase superfamily)